MFSTDHNFINKLIYYNYNIICTKAQLGSRKFLWIVVYVYIVIYSIYLQHINIIITHLKLTANKMFQNNALMMIPVRTVRIMGRWSPTKPAACPRGRPVYRQPRSAVRVALSSLTRAFRARRGPTEFARHRDAVTVWRRTSIDRDESKYYLHARFYILKKITTHASYINTIYNCSKSVDIILWIFYARFNGIYNTVVKPVGPELFLDRSCETHCRSVSNRVAYDRYCSFNININNIIMACLRCNIRSRDMYLRVHNTEESARTRTVRRRRL